MAIRRFRRRSLAEVRAQADAAVSGRSLDELRAIKPPRKKPRHIESQHGRALIKWRNRAMATRPKLRWLHHIPNGVVMGSERQAGMLKAEGLTKGVLDYFLPVTTLSGGEGFYAGLYVELKADGYQSKKNGGMSDDQVQFAQDVVGEGFAVALVYDWQHAVEAIEAYLDGKPIPHQWSPPA
jgi:hypothetical protein